VVFLIVLLAMAGPASAQGFGVRGGVGVISNGYVGGHYDARLDRMEGSQPGLQKVRELWFRPSFELTIGDPEDDWLPRSMINLEFRIQRSIGSRWSSYAGTGMTISRYQWRDRRGFEWHEEAGWRKGAMFVTGIASQRGTFIEAKFDPTLLKFGVGYTFGRK
jgi:hypothetical protein